MKIGVIVGRFQVPLFHDGHLKLFKQVKEKSDQVVVGIGVGPVDGFTAENPFTWQQRAGLFNDPNARLWSKGITIIPIIDQPDDYKWSTQLDWQLSNLFPNSEFVLYGGRDSGCLKGYSGKLPKADLDCGETCSGTAVRSAIVQASDCQFMRGQAYALNHQYPRVIPTVDIAHVRYGQSTENDEHAADAWEVVLIKRSDTGEWGFPGGFVEAKDKAFKWAAARELLEETGLTWDTLKLIGVFTIDDWRYRGSRDCIMTSFFLSQHSFGYPKAGDDAVEAKWVRVNAAQVAPVHQVLLDALKKELS